MPAIAFSRLLGPVPLDVVLTEAHQTEIGITSNPIETGAEVNDHAYVMPKRVTLEFADADATATFNALVAFQETRIPFILVTGLAIYRNMLIKSLSVDRDKDQSRILRGSAECQEVIIVGTSFAPTSDANAFAQAGVPGLKSAVPSSTIARDVNTAVRAAGVVARGDSPVSAAPLVGNSVTAAFNRSVVGRIFP